MLRVIFLLFAVLTCAPAQTWRMQSSGTTASVRGLVAVDERVLWASGAKGTFLRTTDGGEHWLAGQVAGAEELDFRGVAAFDSLSAVLMSSGAGEKSRVYRTADGGKTWTLLFTNPDAAGFFDAVRFADPEHGVILGDPVGGSFVVLRTADGGKTWGRAALPPALEKEGAFAASNSVLELDGKQGIRFVTGGPGGGRLFRSANGGVTWTVTALPLRNDGASAGAFSLAFAERDGVVVGGDYQQTSSGQRACAITADGGKTWSVPERSVGGYRSSVVWAAGLLVATGPTGSDVSRDRGRHWETFEGTGFHVLAASGGSVWGAGPNGAVSRLAR